MTQTAKKKSKKQTRLVEIAVCSATDLNSTSVGVGDGLPPQEVLKVILKSSLRHLCQASTPTFDVDVEAASNIIQDAGMFFDCPLSAALQPQTASKENEKKLSEFQYDFSALADKPEMLASLQNYLKQKTKSEALISDILIVADELFTNAVFNAPFASTNGFNVVVPRDIDEVQMHRGKRGTITAGTHDGRLMMTCRDPYGSLVLERMTNRIYDCYVQGVENTMTMGPGGAGIGCFMIFSAAASYFAAVDKGRTTLIACGFPLQMNSRNRTELFKNVHFIGF